MFKPGQEEREDSQERTTFLISESRPPAEQPIESFELDQLKYDEKESKVSTLSSFFQRNIRKDPIAGDYLCDYLCVYHINSD